MSWSLVWVDHWSGCPDTQDAARDGRTAAPDATAVGRNGRHAPSPMSSRPASLTSQAAPQPVSTLTDGIDPRIAAAAHSALERTAQVQDSLLDPAHDPAPDPV